MRVKVFDDSKEYELNLFMKKLDERNISYDLDIKSTGNSVIYSVLISGCNSNDYDDFIRAENAKENSGMKLIELLDVLDGKVSLYKEITEEKFEDLYKGKAEFIPNELLGKKVVVVCSEKKDLFDIHIE